jgi:4-hydroxybenzoate polyprenyltransferase
VISVKAGFSTRGVLAGIAMSVLTAFGFQVNDILDFHKDRAAGVRRPIAMGLISRTGAMLFALALLCLAFAISAWTGSGSSVLAVTAIALVLYTPSARKLPLLKGLYVAGLCAVPLYYGSQVTATQYPWPSYALLAIFILGREALMDANELRGDRSAGMITIAALFGENRTKWFGVFVMALSMMIFAALFSARVARVAAVTALVSLLGIFLWPRLDGDERIALSRLPMLAGAVAIACG